MTFPVALLLALSFGATGLMLAFVTKFMPRNAPLGVRVPAEHLEDPIIARQVQRYQRRGVFLAVLVAVVMLLAAQYSAVTVAVAFVQVIAALWNISTSAAPIKEKKAAEGWFDGVETRIHGQVTALEETALLDRLPSMFWAVVPYLLSLLVIAIGAMPVMAAWDSLPETIPTHWNGNMEADAWSDKSILAVFGISFVGLGCTALFGLISWGVEKMPVQTRTDRTPAGALRTQASMRLTAVGMAWFNLALAVGFALMQTTAYAPAAQRWQFIGFVAMLILALGGALVMTAWIVTKQGSFAESLRGHGGADSAESPDNDEHYKWGVFYYNPEDPAVLVEKRFGVGVDFNYARWQAKVFLVAIAALCIGPLALIFI